MLDGTWTIESCSYAEVQALARELELSETTASILVRRGYADPDAARAFLDGEREPHDPLLLGDMAEAVERIRAAVAAGTRICVHGDYDVDGICATALAVLTLRELGAEVEWHLPSRFEEGYGVSSTTIARLAEDGCGLVLTVDCGITAVEEVAEAKALGLEVVVTDHHRPARDPAGLPDRRHAPVRLPLPGALRHGCRPQAGAGPARRRPPGRSPPRRPRRARDHRRRRPAPRREPLARDRGPARARADAEARAARADAQRVRRPGDGRRRCGRLPPRAEDQRRRPAGATRHGARAPADREPGGGDAPRRRAGDAEPRPPGGRGPHPALGGRPGGGVARAEAPPPRLRALGRGLARGRDRHRRLAPRRALQPARRADHRHRRRRLEGLRPLRLLVRPARRARGLIGAPEAVRRPPCGRGPLDRPGAARGLRAVVRRARRPRAHRPSISCRRRGSTRSCRAASSPSASRASSSGWRRSGSATRT